MSARAFLAYAGISLACGFVVIFALMWEFVRILRTRYYALWEDLGRPSVFRSSLESARGLSGFLWGRHFLALHDRRLTRTGVLLMIATLLYFAVFTLMLLVSFFTPRTG